MGAPPGRQSHLNIFFLASLGYQVLPAPLTVPDLGYQVLMGPLTVADSLHCRHNHSAYMG